MEKVLLHCCCAPCSVSCVGPLRAEGIEPVGFWYNPNIHPFKEYEARRDCFTHYCGEIDMEYKVCEEYGLRSFVKNVANDIENRCYYCYYHRLDKTAEYAKENGFSAFTTTLLASTYQNHERIKAICEEVAKKHKVQFLYKDFREKFHESNRIARENGLYMQKYCGCIFSEEDRYQKQIIKAKEKFNI